MLVRYDKILKIFLQQNQRLRNISFVLPVNASNALLFNIYHCFFIYLFHVPKELYPASKASFSRCDLYENTHPCL